MMTATRLTRLLSALLLPLMLVALAARPAAAAPPGPPPPFLNPPPDPGATCQATGTGWICHDTFPFTETNAPAGALYYVPTGQGLSCGGNPIQESATGTIGPETFVYNQSGNLTQAHVHYSLNGMFVDAATGQSVPFASHVTLTVSYAVPADFTTATLTFAGQVYGVTIPGSGVIVQDAGNVVIAASDGSILSESGPHPVLAALLGESSAIQPLCAALA